MKDGENITRRIDRVRTISFAGNISGKGVFMCLNCGNTVIFYNDREILPLCPKCHGRVYQP